MIHQPGKVKKKCLINLEAPLCAMLLDKGGYTVHPVPVQSTILPTNRSVSDGGNNLIRALSHLYKYNVYNNPYQHPIFKLSITFNSKYTFINIIKLLNKFK